MPVSLINEAIIPRNLNLSLNLPTNDPDLGKFYSKNVFPIRNNEDIDTNLASIRNSILNLNINTSKIFEQFKDDLLKEYQTTLRTVTDFSDIENDSLNFQFENLKNNYGNVGRVNNKFVLTLPNISESLRLLNQYTQGFGDRYELKNNVLSLTSGIDSINGFNSNIILNQYKPIQADIYEIRSLLRNSLSNLPYLDLNSIKPLNFTKQEYDLIGVFNGSNISNSQNDSELGKNGAIGLENAINERIKRNIEVNTVGRLGELIDASTDLFDLEGLFSGRIPLSINDFKITKSSNIIERGLNSAANIAGVLLPQNPFKRKKRVIEIDNCSYNPTQNPTYLFPSNDEILENTSKGQKSFLLKNLKHNKFTPNYVAKDSDLFGRIFGNDLNGFPSNSYFINDEGPSDSIDAKTNFADINTDSGPSDLNNDIFWFQPDSINNLENVTSDENEFISSLDTSFYKDSILCKTNELIKKQTANNTFSTINQANRYFRTKYSRVTLDGAPVLSKGNATKSFDVDNQILNEEFCRVWTKNNQYDRLSKTIRPFKRPDGDKTNLLFYEPNSVLQENGLPRIAPTKRVINGQTVIEKNKPYMFSLENLAWVGSNLSLSCNELGPNGGRIMWFPPYDLKFNESDSINYTENEFIGRPEPIYTYNNSKRPATLSFKIIIDSPSIMRYIISKENSEGKSDELLNAEIESFLYGCHYYSLDRLRKNYPNLSENELVEIQNAVTGNLNKIETNPVERGDFIELNFTNSEVYFDNDSPGNYTISCEPTVVSPEFTTTTSNQSYDELYNEYISKLNQYAVNQDFLLNSPYNLTEPEVTERQIAVALFFSDNVQNGYNKILEIVNEINNLEKSRIKNISLILEPSTSNLASTEYNRFLALRRADSVKKMIAKLTNLQENLFIVNLSNSNSGFEFDINKVENEAIKNDLTDCTKPFVSVYSREAYENRYVSISNVRIEYTQIDEITTNQPNEQELVKNNIDSVKNFIRNNRRKNFLPFYSNECEYFDYLEVNQPIAFNNISKKLKYFTPAFHSTTPEGFNARLTFLKQCARPSNTIDLLSNNGDVSPIDAVSNTVFGKPPICILRIGDFYNSKIVIKDINYDYEQTLDLNPEGIGIQPNIVNVTISFDFIGGQGMNVQHAIDKIQNALDFNYFANTELYDTRSVSTSSDEENNAESSNPSITPRGIRGNTFDNINGELFNNLA